MFEKGDKRKNYVRFCKYTFLIFKRGNKRKNCARSTISMNRGHINIWGYG